MNLLKEKINELKNYSWLSARRLILTLIIFDFIGIFSSLIITNFIYGFYFIGNVEAIIMFISYSSLSYIFGRYKLQNNYKKNFRKDIIIKDIAYISILIIIYFLIINSLYQNQENNSLFMRKIPFFVLSIIICNLSSIKLKRNFKKYYKNQQKFVFSGSDYDFKNLKKILDNNELDFKFIVGKINYGEKIDSDCNGIIFNRNTFNESDLRYFLSEDSVNKIDVYFIDNWLENNLNRIPNEYINYEKFIRKYNLIKENAFQNRVKRFGDVILSISLLFFLSPILILAGIFIWSNDLGPIIYSQRRVGKNGKEFKIYKLRTMIENAEKYGAEWVSLKDKRITFIGKILRRTRIDEIPQLICVLNGDMSLIGPRPERPEIEVNLKNSIKNYELRYLVKPGLSGWAQVNSNYAASLEGVKLKLSYDFYYISNQSLWIDFLIFIKTIKVVFTAKGSEPI
tara:strand:- start:920 stop:2281 length:1362 start_codon:yes stop_codon:yes gene_type:complete